MNYFLPYNFHHTDATSLQGYGYSITTSITSQVELHSLVPPAQNFTAKTRFAISPANDYYGQKDGALYLIDVKSSFFPPKISSDIQGIYELWTGIKSM